MGTDSVVLFAMSDHGIVIGVAEPRIDGITVVRLTGSKEEPSKVTLVTNWSAGDAVILAASIGANVVELNTSGAKLDIGSLGTLVEACVVVDAVSLGLVVSWLDWIFTLRASWTCSFEVRRVASVGLDESTDVPVEMVDATVVSGSLSG